MTIPSTALNDGAAIPRLGFGTYRLTGEDGMRAIRSALESGYRLLDTAARYGNEAEVGEAIRSSGVDPAAVVVTTKLPGRDHGYEATLVSARESLRRLGRESIDLYLIHWPLPRVDRYVDSWRAMIDLRDQGLVRSIGVSNFTPAMLTRLIEETGVAPAVNQVELHPYFPQRALREFHVATGIQTESWSPLARRTDLLAEPAVVRIARAHGVSPTRAVLRWHIELGSIPIPKSAHPARQRENADVFGFALSAEEVQDLAALERGRIWGGDPVTHEEF